MDKKKIIKYFMVILFVLISGASPSVVRAGIMAIILILSEILSRAPNTYSTVATTAIFILLYNPFIICDIGFLLSFGGTLGIRFFNKKITETMKNKFPKISETSFGKIVFESLSDFENKVYSEMKKGLKGKEIAEKMKVNPKIIYNCVYRIKSKLY